MDFIERLAEKIVPIILIGIVGAVFTMYMDLQFLKLIASKEVETARKIHVELNRETRLNRESLIRLEKR